MQITKLESVNDVDKLVDRLFGMRNQVEKRKYAKKQLHKIFREADGPVYVLIDDGSPAEGWAFPQLPSRASPSGSMARSAVTS